MARSCLLVGLIFVTFVFWVNADEASKYGKNSNEARQFENLKPFRMMKLNLVWEKAQKRMSSGELVDFYKDLLVQDRLEIDLKKRQSEGFDEEGEYAARTRKHFISLLDKYDLYELHPESATANPQRNEQDRQEDRKWEKIKMDKKLGRLWKKAQMSGFSDDELDALRSEFLHHQEKVEEFEVLKEDLNRNLYDISDNTVEGIKENKMKMKKEERLALKEKYGDLSESYKALEEALLGAEVQDEDDFHRFKHPKVMDLWVQAKRVNFTEEELRSFAVELQHFQHKLDKLDHFNNEAKDGTINMKKMGANLENHPDKRIKLEGKVNDYGRKMQKIESELRDRIIKKHSEL